MKSKNFPLASGTHGNRVAIYARVSTQSQADEGFSLEAQSKACRKFAEDRGWQIVEEFTEPGISAKDDNRPQFQKMIRLAKSGRCDIILTHKLDRFSRSLLDVLTYLRDLNEAGVAYVSAAENFDFSTPMGKMQLHMMAAMAQWYLDNLSQETQKGKKARAEAGYWNGDVSFGYRSTEEGELVIDEKEADGVRMAFRLSASGAYTDREIAQVLTDVGLRPRGKRGARPFSKDTIRALLINKFYLGFTKYRKTSGRKQYDYFPGQHPAIIDQALWDKCQQARQKHYGQSRTSKPTDRVYPLTGLIKCASCQTAMRGQGARGSRYYKDPAHDYGKACDQSMVRAELLEEQLFEFFDDIKITDEMRARVMQKLGGGVDAKREEKQRAQLTGQLERAKKLFVIGDIGETEYLREKARLESAVAQIQPTSAPDLEQAADLLQSIGTALAQANDDERKRLLHVVLDEVHVEHKKVVAIRPKPKYYDLLCMSLADPTGVEQSPR